MEKGFKNEMRAIWENRELALSERGLKKLAYWARLNNIHRQALVRAIYKKWKHTVQRKRAFWAMLQHRVPYYDLPEHWKKPAHFLAVSAESIEGHLKQLMGNTRAMKLYWEFLRVAIKETESKLHNDWKTFSWNCRLDQLSELKSEYGDDHTTLKREKKRMEGWFNRRGMYYYQYVNLDSTDAQPGRQTGSRVYCLKDGEDPFYYNTLQKTSVNVRIHSRRLRKVGGRHYRQLLQLLLDLGLVTVKSEYSTASKKVRTYTVNNIRFVPMINWAAALNIDEALAILYTPLQLADYGYQAAVRERVITADLLYVLREHLKMTYPQIANYLNSRILYSERGRAWTSNSVRKTFNRNGDRIRAELAVKQAQQIINSTSPHTSVSPRPTFSTNAPISSASNTTPDWSASLTNTAPSLSGADLTAANCT